MPKVTSKYQVTVPKAIAEQYRIRPGDEIEWIPSGDAIRVIPAPKPSLRDDREYRLRLFDRATQRTRRVVAPPAAKASNRGWKREDLYDRGSSR